MLNIDSLSIPLLSLLIPRVNLSTPCMPLKSHVASKDMSSFKQKMVVDKKPKTWQDIVLEGENNVIPLFMDIAELLIFHFDVQNEVPI